MAAPSYVANSSPVATTTSAVPSYPAGLLAGDLIVLFVSTNGTAIGSAPAGWTAVGTTQTGGGMSVRSWWRIATGSETGTQTVSGLTSGTKGASWMTAYRGSGGTLSASGSYGSQTVASTSVSVTGGSLTTQADDLLVELGALLAAAAGTFSSAAFNPVLTQGAASLTNTPRLASRTGTNTVYFNQMSATVASGDTAAPVLTATAVGANATGSVSFLLVREAGAATPATVAAVPVTASTAAPAPAVSAGASVTAPVQAGTGTARVLSVSSGAVLAAPGATANTQARVPGVSGSASLAAPVVPGTAQALAPAVAAAGTGSVQAVRATATGVSLPSGVAGAASVGAVKASSTGSAGVPEVLVPVSVGVPVASGGVTALGAVLSAQAFVPVVPVALLGSALVPSLVFGHDLGVAVATASGFARGPVVTTQTRNVTVAVSLLPRRVEVALSGPRTELSVRPRRVEVAPSVS